MKKKINSGLIIVILASIIITMLLSAVVCYEIIKKETFSDLKTDAMLIINSKVLNDTDNIEINGKYNNLRVTVIKEDGSVIFDNYADIKNMENHINRPEVARAVKTGYGEAIRKSETLKKDSFYYAVYIKKSHILLRVSKESGSVYGIITGMLPAIIILAGVLMFAAVLITYYLSRSMIKPMEQLAVEMETIKIAKEKKIEKIKTYPELQPFVDTIIQQHEDIIGSSRIRQEFTANVSHELKTPLTAISGYAQLIENEMTTPDETVKFAGDIQKNANRLLILINDIIRLSELDSSKTEPDCEKIDLSVLVKNVVNSIQLKASDNNINIIMNLHESYIYADKMMIEELVFNLTDNAIRYNNPHGTVEITVSSDKKYTILEVKDNGIGISKEHQQRIFERFYRVDKSRSKQSGGTGLGLAIVKHIVAKNDATLKLSSEEGVGTTIQVTFKN